MNKMSYETILNDLSVFADLGTQPPELIETDRDATVVLTRLGLGTRLSLHHSGEINESFGADGSIRHASFRSLLASERYGDLRSWAGRQSLLLEEEAARSGSMIQLTGHINGGIDRLDIEAVDTLVATRPPSDTTYVLLIDGPAGIGKTYFISALARMRAQNYARAQRPLILHVESRGRQLSYIYDLIAFSLQRLRASTTYDQVPILVKHGLITIAIDGFDELADPNGYNLAWAQVNELVNSVKGEGSLILAGRETFIGRRRVMQDIKSLDEGSVDVLTLSPPTPNDAKQWLQQQGLEETQVQALDAFLEQGSIALRPFFLKKLADPEVARQIGKSDSDNILSILVEAMLRREATKFGDAVDEELSSREQEQFVRNIMYEVARDLADNQTTAIDEATLSWLVEASLPKDVSQPIEFLLKNRTKVIGFLTVDDRPRHLKFFHDKFYEYFLARVIIDTIGKGEVTKFVARNLFGGSFLETLAAVIGSVANEGDIESFFASGLGMLRERISFDRSRRNIGAFLFAGLHLAEDVDDIVIESVEMDEVRVVGTSAPATLSSILINQLDARGADVSKWAVTDGTILTMIVDNETRVPDGFCAPARIVDVSVGGLGMETSPDAISEWLAFHSPNPPQQPEGLVPESLRDHPAVRLLQKACRMRQYWLRPGDDKFADRILSNEHWKTIERLLLRNNLLNIEVRDASGTDARFYHIKYADSILGQDKRDRDVVAFYKDLVSELATETR